MKKSSRHAHAHVFAGVLLLALAGCARHPYQGAPIVIRPEMQRDFLENLQNRYPREFRLKQRIALRALGKQYDMIGYLVVGPEGGVRAIAMGEMGGRIFDLALDGGKAKVLKKPEKMPPNPLLDGVIGDIRHLYTFSGDVQAAVHLSKERGCYLSLCKGDAAISDYHFHGRGDALELVRSLESDGRRIIREIEYADYRQFANIEHAIPTLMVLKNHRWHYTMEIQTLEITTGLPAAEGR